jgi:hypothetical protein
MTDATYTPDDLRNVILEWLGNDTNLDYTVSSDKTAIAV